MTLDDQLAALAPLDSGVVARLAGYSAGPAQLRLIRLRGSRMPDAKLIAIAERLERLAQVARVMVLTTTASPPPTPGRAPRG